MSQNLNKSQVARYSRQIILRNIGALGQKKIIKSNPNQVEAYKRGKDKLFGFFVGQVMKETQGKANPKSANEILKKLLG